MNLALKNPWDISYTSRLQKLKAKSSKKNVVYIYERPDSSTFRYRAYNMCQALEYSDTWSGIYFFENELSILENAIANIQLVVFVRTPWSYEIDTFYHKVKKHKIQTLFDVDDLVFNVEKIPLILHTLGSDLAYTSYSNWFSYVSRLWLMGKMCDATSGTNEFLLKHLRDAFDKPSFIINNFLNHEQIEISASIYAEKLKQKQNGTNFTIGYFSGSPSHKNDLKKIVPELQEFLNHYPEARLEVVGYMEFPELWQDLIKKGQIYLSSFVDFRILQEKIAKVDLNIVPLINNDFTNCKSELKFFEASIVGTPTCASPSYCFENCIQNGQTGFICEEGDWYPTLEKIFKKEFAPSMLPQAREYCLDTYPPKSNYRSIEKVLESLS